MLARGKGRREKERKGGRGGGREGWTGGGRKTSLLWGGAALSLAPRPVMGGEACVSGLTTEEIQ